MTDTEIIDLFFARSEQAIAALSQQYGRLLRHTADNILGSPEDAEECVNDSYLAVWNTVPPKRPDPLPAYCLRIVRNLSLSLLRRRGAQKRDSAYDCALDELSETLAGPESVEDACDARLLGACIDRFLDTLEVEDRVLFVRRYWFGDSVRELAAMLGCGENRLSVRLFRLRGRLKETLIKEGIVR